MEIVDGLAVFVMLVAPVDVKGVSVTVEVDVGVDVGVKVGDQQSTSAETQFDDKGAEPDV
jgi:hypothetical protein